MVVVEKSISQFAGLSLDGQRVDEGRTGALVDVKDHLRRLTAELAPESVVKEATFSLFDGTYALEVCNVKLDTSLIELSPEEEAFDCNTAYGDALSGQRLQYVTAVCDRLCRLLMAWLHEYQTVPTTVLSCRYVEHVMQNYTANPCSSLHELQGLETGDLLYDKVLYSFVLGVGSLVSFTSKVLKDGAVYEEEDLCCNTMNLNMISEIDTQEVINSLEESLKILRQSYPSSEHLQKLTDLLKHVLHLPEYHFPSRHLSVSSDLTVLEKALEIVKSLQTDGYNFAEQSYPPGCFSKGVQKRRDNNFPPKEILEPKGDEFDSFEIFINDILAALSVKDCNTTFEIHQYLWFFNRLHQRTAMARALLQSYLVRDDFIIDKYQMETFRDMSLYEFSLAGTALYEVMCNSDGPKGYNEVSESLNELTLCLLRYYQNSSQNFCRRRQGFNRLLLDWDSIQANCERHEIHWQSLGIDDKITSMNDISLMPVTTWIYTHKLLMMIEFTLEGFHLEVYKPWESFTAYWFGYYLASHLESNLKRLHEFLLQRINYIHNFHKKVKKLKAGEKKEKARTQYKYLTDHIMPQLKENKKTVNYYFLVCTILKSLCLAQVFQFALLKSFKIIDSKSDVSNRFSSDELIHKLRFKTFSSIGIPEVPTYDQFQKSLQDFIIHPPSIHSKIPEVLNFMFTELENAKIALSSIISTIETGEQEDSPINTGTKHTKETALKWFNSLLHSTSALKLNASVMKTRLTENVKSNDLHDVYQVELKFTPHGCYYFPLLSLKSARSSK